MCIAPSVCGVRSGMQRAGMCNPSGECWARAELPEGGEAVTFSPHRADPLLRLQQATWSPGPCSHTGSKMKNPHRLGHRGGKWGAGHRVSVPGQTHRKEKEVPTALKSPVHSARRKGARLWRAALSRAPPGKAFEAIQHPHPYASSSSQFLWSHSQTQGPARVSQPQCLPAPRSQVGAGI